MEASRQGSDDRERALEAERLAATLAAAARGDQDAWRTLLDAYTPRVFGLIRSQCGDSDLAEEITQSTFCTIAAKLGEYVELGRFESWIFRIAMNRLRDEMRRRKRHAVPMDSGPLTSLASGTASGAGVGGRGPSEPSTSGDPDRLGTRLLREAMASLGEADREVMNLRHIGGLSFKQMADALDEPLGTLLARHHRALRKLREYLEARGFDADAL